MSAQGVDDHLDSARGYAQPLEVEKQGTRLQFDRQSRNGTSLEAAQGEAMRLVVYHSAAAVVEALRELTCAVDSATAAIDQAGSSG